MALVRSRFLGFIELQDEYRSQGLALFGVSIDDSARAIKLFAEEYKVNYPMLVGLEEEAFMEAYGPLWGISDNDIYFS